MIAAVEYGTRYPVATTVQQHTADKVTEFLMRHVVLNFGPFRGLLTDGAPELTSKVIERLVVLLQTRQTNPVPYRPQRLMEPAMRISYSNEKTRMKNESVSGRTSHF